MGKWKKMTEAVKEDLKKEFDDKVEMIMLRCLECGREVPVAANGIYFTIAGLNYFCGGDCEDKYAFKQ
jgi:translation initiation factor 2 beta subunit (eIF-2beta)/eIF-5